MHTSYILCAVNWQQAILGENSLLRIVIGIGLILLAFAFRKLPERLLVSLGKNKFPSLKSYLFEQKNYWFMPVLVTLLVLNYLIILPENWRAFIFKVFFSILVIIVVLRILHILKHLASVITSEEKAGYGKRGAIRFYYRLIEIVSLILLAVYILSVWGVRVGSVLAGLGLGGLAISLAAQDTFSNLIAGFVLLNDDGLKVGEDIETKDFSGTILNIGLRSTQLRGYDRMYINVPNRIIAESPYFNVSRADKRRITFSMRLPLDITNEEIQDLEREVQEFLRTRERIESDNWMTCFDSIQENGIDFFFRFFVLEPSFQAVQEEKAELLKFVWHYLKGKGLTGPARIVSFNFASSELFSKNELLAPMETSADDPKLSSSSKEV